MDIEHPRNGKSKTANIIQEKKCKDRTRDAL